MIEPMRPSQLLDLVLGAQGSQPCMLGPSSVNYEDLRGSIKSHQRDLRGAGVASGCVVALRMPASYTFVYCLFALWSMDCRVVLVDARLKHSELREVLGSVKVDALVTFDESASSGLMFREEVAYSVTGTVGEAETPCPNAALVQFTSGSTARPKAICRTARSIYTELRKLASGTQFVVPGDRVLILSSLSHSYGLIVGLLQTLACGATVVFSASAIGSSIRKVMRSHRPTVILGVPAHYGLMIGVASQEDFECVRLAVSGGQKLDAQLWQAYRTQFGIRIGQAYGMTETGLIAADPMGRHPGGVGPLLEPERARVSGYELLIKSEQTPYISQEGPDLWNDGWLHTRDRARICDGVVVLGGRLDSLVVVGGLKVDLGEIEDALLGHEGVEAAVVLFDTRLEAFVGTESGVGAAELLRWCALRIADYKLPTKIVTFKRLPRTVSGKLVRDRERLVSMHRRSTEAEREVRVP